MGGSVGGTGDVGGASPGSGSPAASSSVTQCPRTWQTPPSEYDGPPHATPSVSHDPIASRRVGLEVHVHTPTTRQNGVAGPPAPTPRRELG